VFSCNSKRPDNIEYVLPILLLFYVSTAEVQFRHLSYGAIPCLGGKFYWDLIYNAITAGAEMLYVGMYDEIDEGTAIIKVSDSPPNSAAVHFVGNDGVADDHYLFLTGKAAQMLRGEIRASKKMPARK
jgi:hypothetical protein